MATAKRAGGLYFVGETPVDSEGRTIVAELEDGKVVKPAPVKEADTDRSLQPGSLTAPTAEDRLAAALAKHLTPKAAEPVKGKGSEK